MRREANFQTYFRHWLKENPMLSGAFELKQTITSSIPFASVKEHQVNALLASKSKTGILYKVGDDSIGAKPFDFFYLSKAFAWVVIKYPTAFFIIDIETFVLESKRSVRRSLTYTRAKDIAIKVIQKTASRLVFVLVVYLQSSYGNGTPSGFTSSNASSPPLSSFGATVPPSFISLSVNSLIVGFSAFSDSFGE